MRNGTSNRRSRSRNNRGRSNNGGTNRSQVFDSNGPEVRIRGTAHQICEKYEALAKDARSVGDLVLAESYLQHAEHYQRMIVMWNDQDAARQAERQNNQPQETKPKEAETTNTKKAQNDDLALPASILGGEVKAQSEAGRTSQRALEDA